MGEIYVFSFLENLNKNLFSGWVVKELNYMYLWIYLMMRKIMVFMTNKIMLTNYEKKETPNTHLIVASSLLPDIKGYPMSLFLGGDHIDVVGNQKVSSPNH